VILVKIHVATTKEIIAPSAGLAGVGQLLPVRMDAGNDSRDHWQVCLEAGVNLPVQRNLRKRKP